MHSLSVSLEPGKTVHVKLVKARYITQEFSYTVPSTAAAVTKTMTLQPGALYVTTSLTGASITVEGGGGVATGTTPFYYDHFGPGPYSITITKLGYVTITDNITIKPGEKTTKSYTLTLKTGTLSVTTSPTAASVKVGTDTKTSPCNFTLAAGTYTVTISITRYDTIMDSVTITAGQTTTKSYTLTLSKVTITFVTKKEDGTALTGVEVWIDEIKKGVT